MKRNFTLYVIVAAAFLLKALPVFAFGGQPAKLVTDDSGRFKIASNISANKQKLIQDDFRYLSRQDFSIQDPELNTLLHIQNADSSALSGWLAERLQYIIGEDYDGQKNVTALQANFPYSNPNSFPALESDPNQPKSSDPSSIKVVMQNIGAVLYTLGKRGSYLIGMQIPGGDLVALRSPRTGIIQVGDGLFLSAELSSTDLNSKVNRIFRISTFFHEAHHSDGNSESLGFNHAFCPAGHLYEHRNACDRNLNGPYSVGARVIRAFAQNCRDCSANEIEMLNLMMLDAFSRVISETPKDPNLSPAAAADLELSECEYIAQNPGMKVLDEVAQHCATVVKNAAPVSTNDETPSTVWDDSPEGTR